MTAEIECDVLIVGGGLVGLSLGIMLSGGGASVAVVDRAPPESLRDDALDGRASAIARGSQQALEAAGIWPGMAAEAQPILEIRVSDGQVGRRASALFLHYDHEAVGGEPLGFMVENRVTRRALAACLAEHPTLAHLAPAEVAEIQRGRTKVEARLADGRRITARLLVGADGRNSAVRAEAGIRANHWDYRQSAIVCTLGHDLPHNGVAHECFLPAGPFAMLPLTDGPGEAGGPALHRSSIVWTERRDLLEILMREDDERLALEIERRFGSSLGAVQVLGRRWSYPLSLTWASQRIGHRLALVGDAAQAIHPIAGQGFNLGLRDAAALAELIVDSLRLGLDPGAADRLAAYERWRRFDMFALLAVTDGLNRLFSNDLPPIRLLRDLGLSAVNRMPLAKRFFMRHAMGLVGELPRLVQGRPL